MNTTRTITLPFEEAIDKLNWRVGDTLVIGGVRLPFISTVHGSRPRTGQGDEEYIDRMALEGLIKSNLVHIERQITEPWYAEAERQGWLLRETTNDQSITCISREKGVIWVTLRDSGFSLHWGNGANYKWMQTIEEVLAFATPYHTVSKLIVTAADWKFATDKEVINFVYDTFVRNMAPESRFDDRCLYLGKDQGCAVGCLLPVDKREALDAMQSSIGGLLRFGYVELPENITSSVLANLQIWHDNNMGSEQRARHATFPFTSEVTDPLVFA
jgi:hypothetical protein